MSPAVSAEAAIVAWKIINCSRANHRATLGSYFFHLRCVAGRLPAGDTQGHGWARLLHGVLHWPTSAPYAELMTLAGG